MKISLLLLIAGIGIACAKYIPYEESDLQSLSRVKRSDSNESVPSEERDSSNDDDNNSDDGDSKEEKLRKKLLQQQEKERIRQVEIQRKLAEKRIKEERKEQEKREKEGRKRLERLEKEHQKLEKAQRKAEEKLRKAERKRQEDLREEMDELRNDAVHESAEDFLDTEEESSVEAADVWRNHIYAKYGLTHASTRLEKHAAIRKYMEELGLKPNSTNSERRQAIINYVNTKLSSDPAVRKAIGEQLVSHLSPTGVQKMQTGLVEDIEELDNKTALLNNISLPWAEQAKAQIQDKRRFLFAMSQFLSDILQPQNPNANNGPNGINSANANSPSSDVVASTLPCGNANNSPNTTSGTVSANNLSTNQAPNTASTENAGGLTQTAANEGSQPQGNTINQDIPSIDSAAQPTESKPLLTQINGNTGNPTQASASGTLPALDNVNSQQDNSVNNGANPTQVVASGISQTQSNTVNQDSAVIDTIGQASQTGVSETQFVSSGALPALDNINSQQDNSVDNGANPTQVVASGISQTQSNTVKQDSAVIDTTGQASQTGVSETQSVSSGALPTQDNVNIASDNDAQNPAQTVVNESSQTQGNGQEGSLIDTAGQASQTGASETSSIQNTVNNQQVTSASNAGNPAPATASEPSQTQGNVNQDSSSINAAGQASQIGASTSSSNNVENPTQAAVSDSSQIQGNTVNDDALPIDNAGQVTQTTDAIETSTFQDNVNSPQATSVNSADPTQTGVIESSQTQSNVLNQESPSANDVGQSIQTIASETAPTQNNIVNDEIAGPETEGSSNIQDTSVTANNEVQSTQSVVTEVLPGQSKDAASVDSGVIEINNLSPTQGNSDSQGVPAVDDTVQPTQTSGSEVAQPDQGNTVASESSTQTVGTESSQPQGELITQDSSIVNGEGQTTQTGVIQTSAAQDNAVNQGAPADGSSTQSTVNEEAQTELGATNNQDPSAITNEGQTDQTSVTEPSSVINQEISSSDSVDTITTQSTIETSSIDSATQAGSGDGPSQLTTLDDAPIYLGNIENNIVPNDGISPVVVDGIPEFSTSQAIPVENADENLETTGIASITESSLLPVESQTNDASQGNPEETVTDNVDSITTDAALLLDLNTLEIATTENNAKNNTSATTEVPNSGDTVNLLENVILNQENTESSTTIATDSDVNQEAQTEAAPGLIPVENAIENIENTTDVVVETTEAQPIVDITTETFPETVTDGITVPVEPGASIVEITQQ